MAKKEPNQAPLTDRVRRAISTIHGLDVNLSDIMAMQIVTARLKNPQDPIHQNFVPSAEEPAMPSIDQVFHRVLEIQQHKPEEQRALTREAHLLIAGSLAADVDLVVLGVEAEGELEQMLNDLDTDLPGQPGQPAQPEQQ